MTFQDETQKGESARSVLGEDPAKSRLRKVSNWAAGPRKLSLITLSPRRRLESMSGESTASFDTGFYKVDEMSKEQGNTTTVLTFIQCNS